jgi:hypothetical protein
MALPFYFEESVTYWWSCRHEAYTLWGNLKFIGAESYGQPHS